MNGAMRNGHKRMRGRNNNNNNHHRKSHNPLTRVYESNGPDVKIRGTASQVAEKYIQLARDSQSSGDPVAAENYYQHAEHYFRVIAVAQEQVRQATSYQQPQQGGAPQQTGGDDNFDDGDDDMGPNAQNEPYNPQMQQQQLLQQQQNLQPRNDYQPQQQPQHQPRPPQQQSQPQQQPQYNQGGGNQSRNEGDQEFSGLPSFITGSPPQQQPSNNQNAGQNGNGQNGGNNQDRGGQDRFGRHRRRRNNRGPRPDFQNQQPGQQSGQQQGPPGGQDGGDEPQPGE